MHERAVRVVFDGHAVTPQRSGIGAWAYRLCAALLEHCRGRVELSVYACGAVVPVRTREEFLHAVGRVPEGSLYAVSHQWEIPRLLRNERCDLFHAPDFIAPLFPFRTPVLVTVHDIVPLVYPRLLARSKKTKVPGLYRAVLTASVRRSAAVLTVSEFTRSELVRVLGVDAAKVTVAYPGPSIEVTGSRLPGNLVEQVSGKRYFLSVGRSDPYKGLPLLAAAYRRALDRAGKTLPDLVLAGKHDARYDVSALFRDEAFWGKVHRAGYVDDDALSALYAHACALVFPSLYEGFGLPVLDAMAHGTPVICSGRASLPEVAGDAALFVDPEDTERFAEALLDVATGDTLRRKLSECGRSRAAAFTWRSAAERVAELYENIASRGGP